MSSYLVQTNFRCSDTNHEIITKSEANGKNTKVRVVRVYERKERKRIDNLSRRQEYNLTRYFFRNNVQFINLMRK
jgi:hypothetical protein